MVDRFSDGDRKPAHAGTTENIVKEGEIVDG
jgi:hypothetical protein